LAGTKKGIAEGRALAAKFRKYSRTAKNEVEEELVTGGLRVERGAKVYVPVDTGRLMNSINSRLSHESGEPYVEVGTNVEYAKVVEWGDSKHSARPYLSKSYNEHKGRIQKDVAEAVKKMLGA